MHHHTLSPPQPKSTQILQNSTFYSIFQSSPYLTEFGHVKMWPVTSKIHYTNLQ
ncbi:hypothetical protein WICANDRAFT_97591 [Wickerhamomyces anomalus NRRL Y-366-8]|uniref:Uncharacterized protein n=1 Tax=Wickerhamomyces anomalus (strain ATCC 58044 / CBS 1984 / NCYC 433 / NRRL Y-366-8) TaxID=683960 RepID=A0A1E3NV52_WICAA|nr:uncharacterized protein WICANDRAFT_97591 [Wickerhamomyces anomalus NRRL Y-366-8]ODQ57079.1 hypothetical protein WICANDRAFT_97591 [Wickerhamomyces anomalus NRRL Y-366-8]